MSKNSSLEALSRRVNFIEQVGDQLGIVLDEFLQSPAGKAYSWDNDEFSEKFGTVFGRIKTKEAPDSTDVSTLDIQINAHGKAHIEVGNWIDNGDGKWIDESDHQHLDIHPSDGVDDAVACVLSATMSSNGNAISKSLRQYLQAKLDPQPRAAFNQTLDR